MTLLTFTFGALPLLDDRRGTHVIHMWISQLGRTLTDDPGDELRAARDAKKLIGDIFAHNRTHHSAEDMKLMAEGEMPPDCLPIFTFAIGVTWDRDHKLPAYKAFDYATLCPDPKFTSVMAVGRELFDYTLSVIKKREIADRRKAGAARFKWRPVSVSTGREDFAAFQRRIVAAHESWEDEKRRSECPHRRNGYCALLKDPGCGHWHIGRCEEKAK